MSDLNNNPSQKRHDQPGASRPHMPGYGLTDADEGSGLFPWSRVGDQMIASRNYWVCTTRPDGRPHAMPVWGIWLDDAFMFSTGTSSVKARNLASNPAIAVHLESGDDVIILEGYVQEAEDPDLLERYADAYETKYDWRPDPGEPDSLTYVLRPKVAFAWLEADFPGTATRWVMEEA